MPRAKKTLQASKISPSVERNERLNKSPTGLPDLPDEVLKARNKHLDLARRASSQRERRSEFFDMMTYTRDYERNRQYANTLLRLKKNDSEVRVNAGTLEKKIDVLVNEIASLNLEAEFRAFDKNNRRYVELGNDLTDIVRITNIQERDHDLMLAAIRELIVQRAVFIQEIFADYKLNGQQIKRPEKRVYSGLKVFVGDVNLPMHDWRKQPCIFRYNRMTYELGESLFAKRFPEMWKYVKPGNGGTGFLNGAFDWRLYSIERREIEVLEYLSTIDNEYQVYIQSVPMLPSGSTMSAEIWKYPCYDMAVSSVKDMSLDWFYGKGVASSGKVLAALSDEMIRSFVRKCWQAVEPPYGVTRAFDPTDPSANKIFTKEVFDPGRFTQGMSKDDIQKLVDHNGVTQSDMAMLEKINALLQEQVGVSDQLQGLDTGSAKTATESMQLRQQALKQIGLVVIGAVRLYRECAYLRLYNILTNYTDVIGSVINPENEAVEDLYRHFVADDVMLENGRRGRKEIFLTDKPLSPDDEEEIYNYENEQEKKGDLVRVHTLDIKKLASIDMDFYCVVAPKEQEGSMMDKAYLSDALNQASTISQLTGRRLNADKAIESFENVWRKKDWFEKANAQQMVQPGMPGEWVVSQPSMPGTIAGAAPLPSPSEGAGLPETNKSATSRVSAMAMQ